MESHAKTKMKNGRSVPNCVKSKIGEKAHEWFFETLQPKTDAKGL